MLKQRVKLESSLLRPLNFKHLLLQMYPTDFNQIFKNIKTNML